MSARWILMLSMLLAAAASGDTRALVVAGLGGTADFETAFARQAKETADALRALDADVTLLLGDMVDRERLGRELGALAERTAAEDTLLLMVVGHGTFDQRDYRFNVPGADVTGTDLQTWLDGFAARRQVVIAATSASGALQEVLADPGRAVITATRSGGEQNASVFAGYFTEALAAPEADTDKDGHIDVMEAFHFARDQVAEHYRSRREMASEHPTVAGAEVSLRLARLAGEPAFTAVPDGNRERLETLEAAIDDLRGRKDELAPDAYYAELQRLLLELAMARGTAPGGGS